MFYSLLRLANYCIESNYSLEQEVRDNILGMEIERIGVQHN